MGNLQEDTFDKTTEHNIYLNQYLLGLSDKMSRQLKNVLDNLRTELLQNFSSKGEPSLAEVRAMQRFVESYLKKNIPILREGLDDELQKLLDIESDEIVAVLQGLISERNLKYSVRPPSKTALKQNVASTTVKGLSINEWFGMWETKLSALIKNTIYTEYSSIEEKNSMYDIIDNIGDIYNNPIIGQSVNNFNGLTLALATATVALVSSGIASNNTGLIEGQVWNSCLCATTCETCASLHGKIRNKEIDETGGADIPLHPYCMCHWSYIYKDEDRMSFPIPIVAQGDINSTEDPKKFQVWYNSISGEEKEKLFGKSGIDPNKSIRKNLSKISSLKGFKKRLQA